jgi:hypothetical protein
MAETLLPTGTAEVADRHDRAQWRVKATREAYAADVDEYRRRYGKAEGERRFFAENAPADVKEEEGNVLTTAETAAQTNLQAATNAFRQAMDATFPTVSGATVTFKATFGTGNANFTWAEWAVFSAVGSGSPPTGGTMLNRKTAALGTKTSAASWAFTVTITLS